jgi:hypothetical protein
VIPRPDDDVEILIFPPPSQTKERPSTPLEPIPAPSAPRPERKVERVKREPAPAAAAQDAPEAEQPVLSDDKETYRNQITEMSVHTLRRYARGVSGLPIAGRQISRANRDELIEILMKVRFPG